MDHFNQIIDASLIALPGLAFLAGLGGSLHCVGMCGGLVSACSPDKKSIWIYQMGRLLGYSLLGLFAGTLGHLISQGFKHQFMVLAPSITLGILFITWGWNSYKGKKEVKSPGFIKKTYSHLWRILIPNVSGALKPFGVGFFSILLPCGLLYSLVITVAAFHDPARALLAMFFFWLGTVPAMALAPNLFKNIMDKLFKRSQKYVGITFMSIGVLTIAVRVIMIINMDPSLEGAEAPTCH